MSEEELIYGCKKHDRNYQRALYELYFEEMMHICMRYAKNQQEAKDILVNGFKNLFDNFENYVSANLAREQDSPPLAVREWIKKEIIASAIQYMRSNKQQHLVSSTVSVRDADENTLADITDDQILASANRTIIITALQQLTSPFRTIYNLHEVDNFSHTEISTMLDITEYTSKDSLSKAKYTIRKNIARLMPKQFW